MTTRPDPLRTSARLALVIGAVGSVALMLGAGTSTPRFLLVIFVFWVLSPFAILAWAHRASSAWASLTRTALHGVTILITLATLAAYAGFVKPPAGSPAAFVFVLGPPLSWLLTAITLLVAAAVSRRR